MSSKSIDKKFQEIVDKDYKEPPLFIRNVIIPFSVFRNQQQYIYDGTEKIPFTKRHPLYQTILRNEFVG